MARRLAFAAALLMLVLGSTEDGVGAWRLEIDSRRDPIGPGSVAAGGAHTVMATPDGRVFAWGAGRRGQIGDGAQVDRWTPTLVTTLESVVAVAAGRAHSVALTATGQVFAWGANASGRLGDGTTKRRPRPVKVKGLSNVRMIAAGRAHTLALTADGRVFAWGRNTWGQLGTGKKVSALAPVRVSGLTDVAAIAAGDAFSLAVTRDGRVFAWGRNQFSMLGDGTTKDRLKPVKIGLADVVSVAAGATHSLALLRSGAVYSWGRGANGELGTGSTRVAATPKIVNGLEASAIAAGRHFSGAIRRDGQLVTWGANGSGQLGDHTTTRRLRPVPVDGLPSVIALALGDAHAVAVTASGDLRTWGEGEAGRLGNAAELDQTAPLEIISDIPDWGAPDEDPDPPDPPTDPVPPTVSLVASPQPRNGWNNTDVTVTFSCADNVAVASCPDPVIVTTDGAGQVVSRSAIDTAGNVTVATVTLNIDKTAPAVEIATAVPEQVSASTLIIDANVQDPVSGLASASCNGAAAVTTASGVRCNVSLRNGKNSVVVVARDVAGNMASDAVLVNRVGTGAASSAYVTPAAAGLIVGESRTFAMTDDQGRAIPSPGWETSDAGVVTLTEGIATAVGPGQATLTATAGVLTATVEVAVYEGPYLPVGATRWNLPGVSAGAIVGHTVIADGFDGVQLFSIEYEDQSRTGATVRALSADGSERWLASLPTDATEAVIDIVAARDAGLLALVAGDSGLGTNSIVRAGWSESAPAWRYDLPSGVVVYQLLQASNGFVYVLQGSVTTNENFEEIGYRIVADSEIVGLDSASGEVVFRNKQPNYVTFTDSAMGPGLVDESHDGASGLLSLTSEGDVYFLRRTGWSSYVEASLFSTKYELVHLSQSGAQTAETLYEGSGDPYEQPWAAPVTSMIADSEGGVLLEWASGARWDAPPTYSGKYRSPTQSSNFELDALTIGNVTSIGGTLIGWQYSSTTQAVALDIRTGDTKWLADGIEGEAAVALDGNGAVFVDANGNYQTVDGLGNVTSTAAHGVPKGPYAYGRFHGRDADGTLKVIPSGPLNDATTSIEQSPMIATAAANRSGVFARSHKVARIAKHVALRVVPGNQRDWRADITWGPQLLRVDKVAGDLWFLTIGAGPTGALPCTGYLNAGLNRESDVNETPVDISRLPIATGQEDTAIRNLLKKTSDYPNNTLDYECVPNALSDGYNSNAFLRGLLQATGLPLPPIDQWGGTTSFPGWQKPVPATYFTPQP